MSSDNKNNVPGVGVDYEIYIPAHFALNLICNKNVKDFSIRSNAQDFGNFDDVVIDITLQDGTSENYAIQLKHKQKKDKKLIPSNFEAKGDFHIEKYCKEFKKLSEEKKQKYHFLLYTNLKFNTQSKNESNLFNILDIKQCQGREFIDTSSSDNTLYKFEAKDDIPDKQDYDGFLSKVTLYTNQGDVDTIKNKILKFFSSEENQGLSYIDLFRKWHQGKFTNKTINRETVLFHVTSILLSKGLITDRYLPTEKNLNLFEEAVRLFDVTLIEDSKNDFYNNLQKEENLQISFIEIRKYLEEKFEVSVKEKNTNEECLKRLAQELKIVDKYEEKLDKNEEQVKCLGYLFRKLLIIDSRQVSNESILTVTKIYRTEDKGIKLILLSEDSFETTSLQCLVFQNLEDLRKKNEDLYFKITAASKVSLQGRDNISLSEFTKDFEEIPFFVGTKEIFNILNHECFLIGEEQEQLPPYFINRKFSITVLDFDSVVKCIKDENNIVIINSQNLYQKLFNDQGIVVISSSEIWSTSNIKKTSIILTNEQDINGFFQNIVKQKPYKSIHYFKIIENKFLLMESTANIFLYNNYKLEKKILDQKDIYSILNGPINIICAEPGMGKTTTMNYLKNTCPNNFWPIGIDLKAHNLFLKNKHSFEDFLRQFLNIKENDVFVNKLQKIFLKRKQFVFFFDGLDELDSDNVGKVLNHIKELSENGFRVWVSSRQNLQSQLESTFNILITDIVELNQDEQEMFIKDRLKDRYNKDEIELFIKKISINTEIIKNQHFLGIPLQLYIITQIFLDKKFDIEVLAKNMFVLTVMYRYFFHGRYKHFISKLTSTNPYIRELEDYLEDYELLALQIVFNSDIVQKLRLDLRRSDRILKKIEKEKDPLGIIVKLDKEGKAVFEHYTYAEYFVCSYLRNNFEKAKLLKEQLFSDQYKNVMLILSIMLAEESPLHLAVIYKNHSEIEKHIEDKSYYDLAGRNPFQVAVCFATCNFENEEKDFRGRFIGTEECTENKEIIKVLLIKFNPYEKDLLFEIDTFQCAVLRKSLFVLELIFENFGMTYEAFVVLKENNYVQNEMIACFSIEWDYPNLLAVALEKKSSHLLRHNSFYCDVLILTTPRIIELLVNYEFWINKPQLLKSAIETDNHKLVEYLLADSDGNHNQDSSFLANAAVTQKWHTVKFFIEKGWKVDDDLICKVIANGQFEIVDMIFAKHQHLDINKYNQLLLRQAVKQKCKNLETINCFLNLKIVILIKSDSWIENFVLHLPVESNCAETVPYLVERASELSEYLYKGLLIKAVYLNGNIEIVQLLSIDNRLLHLACKDGKIEMVKKIYNEIKGVNKKDNFGWTPIFYTAYGGHFDVFKFLIKSGANIFEVSNEGLTLLHAAAMGGNCDIINYLLDRSFDKNAKDNNRKTPLVWAAESFQLDAARYLISKGAEICSSKEILLEYFIINECIEEIKYILKYGTDILNKDLRPFLKFYYVYYQDLENINKITPLSISIKSYNYEVAEFLINHGANVNDIRAFYEAACTYDTSYLNLLFDNGFQLNVESNYEKKLFDLIIREGKFGAVNMLFSNNPQLNIHNIIWQAVDWGEVASVELYIEKGINVNATNQNGDTILLHTFKKKGYYPSKTIKLLIKNDAEINCISEHGETIWKYLNWEDEDLINLIFSKNVVADLEDDEGNTPLYYALKHKNKKAINELLSLIQKYNLNLLLCAIETDNISSIQCFFQKDFQSQIKKDERKIIPIMGAKTKNLEIVKLFLTNDLDINAPNDEEETALFLAIKNNNIDIAKYLILHNADVNCITKSRETIWEYIDWNNKYFIDLVMSKKVNPELANRYNFTPLFYAIYYKDVNSISSLMASHGIDVYPTCIILLKIIDFIVLRNVEIFNLLKRLNFNETLKSLRQYSNIYIGERIDYLTICSNIFLRYIKDIYVRLHFAVYLGNVPDVVNIIKFIDFEGVDKYNTICPLHFALKSRLLNPDLLFKKTTEIYEIYREKKIWTMEDMRKYLLKRFPLKPRTHCQDRFSKYTYLTKEVYENMYKNLLHQGFVYDMGR